MTDYRMLTHIKFEHRRCEFGRTKRNRSGDIEQFAGAPITLYISIRQSQKLSFWFWRPLSVDRYENCALGPTVLHLHSHSFPMQCLWAILAASPAHV